MNRMTAVLTGLIGLFGINTVAIAAPELKGTPAELSAFLQEPVQTVNITGRAKESAYSDIAKITLVVSTNNASLSAALSANGQLREKISGDFVAAGIPADKISSSKFSTSPQFGWFGDKPKSYDVSNRMQIEVTSESQMNAVAAAADNNDEVEFGGVEFEHSKKDATKAAVETKAVEDALRQQAFYEERLGLQLVPVSFFTRDVQPLPRRAVRIQAEEIAVSSVRKAENHQGVPVSKTAAPVSFDEVTYRAEVTVTFEVSPAE